MADAFDLARSAREIDMRASPYDLSQFVFAPVKVETADGRAEYAELQRGLFRLGQPMRERLLALYRRLLVERTSLLSQHA